ncbi:MAG: tetratricopeptide repeat protein [Pseudomonadota bacterium]|nr:tetratricopeptide repeat protein [Pseudomonadota bacterium]
MMPHLLKCFCFVAILISGSVNAQDFRDGLRAFQLGQNERAVVIFRNLASGNNRDAQFMMGVMREGGYGMEKNLKKAAQWYLKAAKAGLPSAQFNLGIFYQLGQGARKSAAEAFVWHNRAALQGHASAQNNLAYLYFSGEGVEKDAIEAWKWYELASRNLKGDARRIASENRDKVSRTLSSDERTAAKRRADDFKPVRE